MRISFLAFCLFISAFAVGPIYAQTSDPQEAYFVFTVPPHPETFVFKLTNSQKIQQARDILSTGNQKVIAGTIIKQPVYYNSPWTFYLDPKSIVFTDFAAEVCDATIRYLEDNPDVAYPDWCPYQSRLLKEIPPPPKPGPGNLPPAISMTYPYADNTFTSAAPASVTLVANADDTDGAISKVEFSSGGHVIGETATYPYSFAWHNLFTGTYTVLATATDDQGIRTSSKSVTFVITTGAPRLLTDADHTRAAALDSIALLKEPFAVAEPLFSPDGRTRLILFGINLELTPEESSSAVTAQAEDSQGRIYVLPVEAVGHVPNFSWLTQVTVKLTDELQGLGDVWVSVSFRGVRSNKVPIGIR